MMLNLFVFFREGRKMEIEREKEGWWNLRKEIGFGLRRSVGERARKLRKTLEATTGAMSRARQGTKGQTSPANEEKRSANTRVPPRGNEREGGGGGRRRKKNKNRGCLWFSVSVGPSVRMSIRSFMTAKIAKFQSFNSVLQHHPDGTKRVTK